MNPTNTLRELLWDNPMTLEATRTLRRTLRAGSNNENPYATRNLNRFLLGTLVFLYAWTIFGIVRTAEDLSTFLLIAEAVLLTLVIPCSLYGAIAVEREKLTYESLMMTRLTPAQIVCGKLWWRIGVIFGIMGVFIPLLLISHVTASSGRTDYSSSALVWTQVVLFSWSLCIGSFSLWVSAKSKKGITALLGVVATLLTFLALIPALLALFNGADFQVNVNDPLGLYNNNLSGSSNTMIDMYRRVMVLVLGANFLLALNPFCMLTWLSNTGQPHTFGVDNSEVYAIGYWQMQGISYWGVAAFLLLAALFVRAAIKTLRGLEKPVAEKKPRLVPVLARGKRGQ